MKGEAIQRYEQAFRNYIGTKYAYSFWRGRVALYAILRSLGVKSGDEVILPGFTCLAVPNAIIFCGAKPVYVDIDPNSYNVTAAKVKAKINEKTKAIIIQHTFGVPADVDPIVSLARGRGLKVIEDCAHALGAKYKGNKVGTLGDAAFFSSQWSKVFSTGLGGLAVTNDDTIGEALGNFQHECVWPSKKEVGVLLVQLKLHEALFRPSLYWLGRNMLRMLSELGLFVGSSTKEERIIEKPKNYAKRLSNTQAIIGLSRLMRLRVENQHRVHMARKYDEILKKEGIATVSVPSWAEPIMLRYPILVEDKEKVLALARKSRIELGSWFDSVLHPKVTALDKAYYTQGECAVAEKITKHIVNLPTHCRVKEKDFLKIVKFLKRECGGKLISHQDAEVGCQNQSHERAPKVTGML